MWVIFCGHYRKIREIDEAYADEAAAAQAAGFSVATIDHDAVTQGETSRALRAIAEVSDSSAAIYRGWMLSPEQYSQFYDGLARKGLTLINTPERYRFCHHLPVGYPAIEAWTPRTRWIPWAGPPSDEQLRAALEPFGGKPVILKDYVKSQKHYWNEACFIPDASDLVRVRRTVDRFIELQGGAPEGGLVFREFVRLKPIGDALTGDLPATLEYRTFWSGDKPLLAAPYWDASRYPQPSLDLDRFRLWARPVDSGFFTMDVAQRDDGEWIIVELGDAQVAGLPPSVEPGAFYERLRTITA